ncbi:hypothetical protein M8C17_27715 [Micromonospora sp. RHAY321]|uniref:hypothetical protein n=1 Tax=Micromonospora sp. RHAY321 TaxID=2944807 RepID=UPI00207CED46|nr:hypothetical protein [Micromonospora sp. RHAY321]MCO1598946.1 hypothetical protein [Micromonospora sp. RHAY321]
MGVRQRHARAGAALVTALVGAVAPAPGTAVAGAPGAGTPVCEVRDDRLTEISGMAATDTGYVVVNDGADSEANRRIFFLDRRCAVVRTVGYPSRPRDTEDLAVGPDGTVWVADIGDNDRSRETVALWRLAPDADRPVLHRMTYPDGPHDAEALLIDAGGRPLIITKGGGSVSLYAPATALRPAATTPLAPVGQVDLPNSTTSNPYSFLGRGVVTGAANAPDGRRVVLRSYADAFEYDVPDGDVVAALTTGTPRVTPLPDEPQGESITYSRDGRSLLTVSESADQPAGTRPTVLRYPASTAPAASPRRPEPTTAGPVAATPARPEGEVVATANRIWPIAAGAGTLLALLGLAGLLRSRRAARR